jgi:hypothetical protein
VPDAGPSPSSSSSASAWRAAEPALTAALDQWLDKIHAEADRLRRDRGWILTPARHLAVVSSLRAGQTEEQACKAAGVTPGGLNRWLEEGEQASRGKHHELYLDVTRAQADHTARVGLGPLQRVEVPLDYSPHLKQQHLHALQLRRAGYKRIVAACAGRRGGKTRGGAAHVAARMFADLEDKLLGAGRWDGEPHYAWDRGEGREPVPFLRYGIVAPTYALLDEPKIALQRALGRVETGGAIVHQTDRLWWIVGGLRIDFLSGDRPERLVSHGYDGLWLDEAARLKPAVWRDNLRPTLSDTRGWALFSTTPLGKNWFWSDIWARGDEDAAAELGEIEDRKPEAVLDQEFRCIAWTTADNTAQPHLAAEMEIARRQMPEVLYRRNFEASFEAFEGQVLDLVASRHRSSVAYTRHGLAQAGLGIDLGTTSKHRAAMTLAGLDHQGTWHALETLSGGDWLLHDDAAWQHRHRATAKTYTVLAYRLLYDMFGDAWSRVPVYVPHDGKDLKRYLRQCGFYVVHAFQLHEDAVRWAQIAVHNDSLQIHSSRLWRCLVGLRFPGDGERSSKLWMDIDDDEWDSLRYALSDAIERGEHVAAPQLAGWMRR